MSRWSGKAIDPSLPSGRSECVLMVIEEQLVAELPDLRRLQIPLSSLALVRQGVDGSTLVFHPLDADYPQLTTKEAGIVPALRATGSPGVARALGDEQRERRRTFVRRWVTPAAILAGLALFSLWFVTGPLIGLVLVALPKEVDVQLGQVALPSMLKELGGRESGPAVEVAKPVVQQLLQPLLADAPKDYSFDLHVVDSDVVNAFALPGGAIVVTTGLLKKSPSADAVAGVIAHEIAHVTNRHSMRGILQKLGVWVLLSAVVGDVSALVSLVMDQATALAHLGFSRDMEAEADRDGVKRLARAGFDPQGLRVFLEATLADEEVNKAELVAGSLQRFLSTHPTHADRISELKAFAESVERSPSQHANVDWAKVQAAMQ